MGWCGLVGGGCGIGDVMVISYVFRQNIQMVPSVMLTYTVFAEAHAVAPLSCF
jgi:hypothetical protein